MPGLADEIHCFRLLSVRQQVRVYFNSLDSKPPNTSAWKVPIQMAYNGSEFLSRILGNKNILQSSVNIQSRNRKCHL